MASTSTTVIVNTHTPAQQAVESPPSRGSHTSGVHRAGVVAETLTLRLVPKRQKKSVKWTEDTVDNEFAGKKSSKKCCIFHKQRAFGEWSDEEDSDPECNCPD